jgi:hypothetical protein
MGLGNSIVAFVVAAPGCLSRVRFFPHPGFNTKKKGKNNLLFLSFRWLFSFHWLESGLNSLLFIIVAHFKLLIENLKLLKSIDKNFRLLIKKIVSQLSEIWVGSGIRKKPIPYDPEVKKAVTGSATLVAFPEE